MERARARAVSRGAGWWWQWRGKPPRKKKTWARFHVQKWTIGGALATSLPEMVYDLHEIPMAEIFLDFMVKCAPRFKFFVDINADDVLAKPAASRWKSVARWASIWTRSPSKPPSQSVRLVPWLGVDTQRGGGHSCVKKDLQAAGVQMHNGHHGRKVWFYISRRGNVHGEEGILTLPMQ